MRKLLFSLGMIGMLTVGLTTNVNAQIQDFETIDTTPLMRIGPINPTNGYPLWIQDSNGLVLELCEDTNDVIPPDGLVDPETGALLPPCPGCVDPLLDLPDPTMPQSFPDNYPDEHFYWLGESLMIENDNSRSIVVLAVEAAFDGLGAVVDGEQIVFTRYRVRIDNASPGELYQITYPFGVSYLEAENDQGGAAISNINFTNDIFIWKGVPLLEPLSGIMGTFLTSVIPPPPPPVNEFTYLGDFCGGGDIQGSPFGTNFFSVVGPDAGILQSTANTTRDPSTSQCDPLEAQMVTAFDKYDEYVRLNLDPAYAGLARIPDNCTRSNEFVALAKPATKLGVQIDRATYNRSTVSGANSTQINVWASTFEGQSLELSIPGVVETFPMCGDGTGKYFAHAIFPSSFIPPSTVTVTNVTDNPPSPTTHALSASLQILEASVDLSSGAFSIAASIQDPDQAGSSLSLGGSALTVDPTDPTIGTADITLSSFACGIVPPSSISLASSQGGTITQNTTIVGSIPTILAASGGNLVVPSSTIVTLDGSASLGIGLSYSWLQITGADVSLDLLWDATSATTSFTFPSGNDLMTFVLTVTDSLGATSQDAAIVTNTVIAAAGVDQNFIAFPDSGVLLDGSASQGAGLSYGWTQVATDTAIATQCVGQTLDAAASISPDAADPSKATLSLPLVGGCVTIELTVTGPGGSDTDTVTIKVPVGSPVANAGTDIVVFATEMVQLDASGSTGIISAGGFAWTQLAGATVDLGIIQSDGSLLIDPLGPPNISMPAFIFPATPQTLTFQVVVSGPGGSSSDIVDVIVDDPGTSDSLTGGRARYDGGKERFTIDGLSSIPGPGHFVTCWLGSPSIGMEIGTSAVDPVAEWKVDAIGGVNACDVDPGVSADCRDGTPTIQIHCISTLGGLLIMDYEARK